MRSVCKEESSILVSLSKNKNGKTTKLTVGLVLAIGLVVFLMLLILDFVEIVDSAAVTTTGHPVLAHGGQHHALSQTFLESAVLTAVALLFRDHTLAFGHARVDALVLDGSFEEALTSV